MTEIEREKKISRGAAYFISPWGLRWISLGGKTWRMKQGAIIFNNSSIPDGTLIHENLEIANDFTIEQTPAVRLSQNLRVATSGSCVCRICHTNSSKELLISPCRCKGTLAYVHLSCLERWLNQSSRNHCELCRYHFNAVETPRYRWSESLRIWISHPRNRSHVQSDLLILTLLTVVTVGLVTVCILGMRYFVIEGRKIGIPRVWTRGSISFFLTIVILGYVTTVYLLAKDQVSPWYRWWKSTVNVRLVMERQSLLGSRNPASVEANVGSFAVGENGVNAEVSASSAHGVWINSVSAGSVD